MSSVYIDAKINSFVTRKLATMGEGVSNKALGSTQTSGIYYETLKLTKVRAKKVQ